VDRLLPDLAQRVQTSMQVVRQLIRQLQESIRRRRNLVEWSKDDDLGSALDDLDTRYSHTGGDSAQSMGLSKGIAGNMMNQLAKVLMPDEIGYNQQHERALTAILQKAIQQVEDVQANLTKYVKASNRQSDNAKRQSGGGGINRRINKRAETKVPVQSDYGVTRRGTYTPRASAEGRLTNRRPINESV